jgi:Leucine-rich repeat (LRR) protein
MAPEQARAEAVDARCDLFSLGCVLYRMCTGEVPFKGKDTMSMLLALAMDTPKPPCELNPEVPPALNRLILNLLAKKPADRPVSAAVVATVLETLAKSAPPPMAIPLAQPAAPLAIPAAAPAPSMTQALPAPLARPSKPAEPFNPWADIDRTSEEAARFVQTTPTKRPAPPRRRRRLLAAVLAAAAVLLAAVIVIRIITDNGELVIESDGSVEVTIKRNGKPVENLLLKQGKNTVSVYSGDIEVVLKRNKDDEYVVKNGRVTLRRGGKELVRIERQDFDRRAAEFVQSISGGVWIRVADKEQDFGPDKALPAERFQVTRVSSVYNGKVNDVRDEGLKYLTGLTKLTSLHLECKSVTDRGLEHLKGLPELESLVLGGRMQITNDGLAHLKGLPKLKVLDLGSTGVSDAGLEHLKELKHLERLALGGYYSGCKVRGEGLRHLNELTELKFLDLRDAPLLTDAGLEHLKGLKHLETLYLGGYWRPYENVGNDGLKHLGTLTSLKYLSLRFCNKVSDIGLQHLAGLTNLTWLELTETQVTAAGVAKLEKVLGKCKINWKSPERRAAEWVRSIGGKVTIRVVDKVKEITDINHLPPGPFQLITVFLDQQNGKVTDAGLENLKGLANLTNLQLEGCKNVGNAGLEHLKGLTSLTDLRLRFTQVSDAGLKHLKELKKLKHLSLVTPCGPVKGTGLVHLKELPNLTNLDLWGCGQVTGDGLEHLKGLTVLGLASTGLTDAGLAHLKELKKLEHLYLPDCTKVSDAGLEHLKGLTKLKELSLAGCTKVSNAGLKHLKALTNLTKLDLTGTQVTADGVGKLEKVLRKCKITWESPDRRAAEWVLSIGGTIEVKFDPRQLAAR